MKKSSIIKTSGYPLRDRTLVFILQKYAKKKKLKKSLSVECL